MPPTTAQPQTPDTQSQQSAQPSALDQQAVDLTRAIRQQESGGNFSQKGASGEYGAYQFEPDTWTKYSQEAGVDVPLAQATPEQQNQVTYNKIKQWKDQGYNVGQIASMWNAGEGKPNAYQENYTGTNAEGVKYDTPSYAKAVATYYQQYKGQNQGNQSISTTAPDQPKTTAGKVLNFLFPIGRDLVSDIKGTSTKTPLQQTGDLALSALPFIPGLGEVGEAAKGTEAAVEGGEALAKGGLGNTIAKGAATGYGAGVASNLSQGQSLGQSFVPNATNIASTVVGGAAPAVLHGLGALGTKISGIDPQVLNELRVMGSQGNPEDAKLYDQYINATKEHATNLKATSPLTMAANNLDDAADQIEQNRVKAGQVVGEAKKAAALTPIKPEGIATVGKNFAQQVEDNYGLQLSSDANGNVTASPIEGTMRQNNPTDIKRIENVATQLNNLYSSGGTAKQASDIMANLNELVDHSKDDVYGHTNDPLEGLLKNTAGNLNGVVRDASPDLATANDRYSGLKDLQQEVSSMAGKNLNKGELLMKRVFSGDKSGDVQDLFEKIKNETGIDLTKHAVFAKNSIDAVGSKSDKSLLEKAIEGGTTGVGGLGNAAVSAGKGLLKKVGLADAESIGRRAVKGKSNAGFRGLVTKGVIEASRSIK